MTTSCSLRTTDAGRAVIGIRSVHSDDEPAVGCLAVLSERPLAPGRHLIAEADGEVLAARSLETGEVFIDPFRATSDLVDLLEVRARQLLQVGRKAGHDGRRGRPGRLRHPGR